MAPVRRKSMVYDIPRKRERYVHCQMDWSTVKWMRRWEHKRMIATMFSMENNRRLLPNWIEHHRSVHQMLLIHLPQLLLIEFHVFSPHYDHTLETDMIEYCLRRNKNGRFIIDFLLQRQDLFHWSIVDIVNVPIQLAIWTIGPSLPKHKPADTDSISPTDLTSNVHFPK